jgi:hypothetical protein
LLKEQKLAVPPEPTPQVFIAALGDEAKTAAMTLGRDLRAADMRVQIAVGERSLRAQMKAANGSDARYAVIIGSGELERGALAIRDLAAPADKPDAEKQFDVPLDTKPACAGFGRGEALSSPWLRRHNIRSSRLADAAPCRSGERSRADGPQGRTRSASVAARRVRPMPDGEGQPHAVPLVAPLPCPLPTAVERGYHPYGSPS